MRCFIKKDFESRCLFYLCQRIYSQIFFFHFIFVMTTLKREREKYTKQYTQGTFDTFGKSEIKPAAFTRFTLYVEHTDIEQSICFLIFFYYPFAINNAKAATFIFFQIFYIIYIRYAYIA